MANKDTIQKTITVAVTLCVVCSVIVSTAAVVLRPAQKANKEADIKTNILRAADMYEPGKSIDEQFEKVQAKLVDLSSGKFSDAVDVTTYDQFKASKDPAMSEDLPTEVDIASLSRLEKYAKVYVVQGNAGVERIILPIRGYGLWSTLKGFIALESDLNTVIGLGYYEHKETPGLGGEVDNPKWKALWPGKKVYDAQGNVELGVLKGAVDTSAPGAEYKVDGLSGATLTSNGVDYMIKFWLGENGFASFLDNLKKGEA
ncbi:Na(+)-translocating NADH-quinone reductase subunit C [Agarilytica rhodophyticola]|uniref:Na(+)-translocating NADH-quinone reductase subunit C n=1 Tax=Agarilytica rhodophyticola TaxID=1737490 RepID=UPI000B344981|nr:Na(+)-translocating NADH-quinone reductase subunit C [Agarilytica rhodophyticola]